MTKRYIAYTDVSKAAADLESRLLTANSKVAGCIGDGLVDDRLSLHTLVNTTLQPNGGEVDVIGTPRIASNLAIPSNVRLHFRNGAYLAPDLNVTVTIAGPFNRHLEKKFGGGGTVLLTPGKMPYANPHWWGAKADGVTEDTAPIDKWLACGLRKLVAPDGTYITLGSHVIPSNTLCKWGRATIWKLRDFAGVNAVSVFQTADGGTHITVEHGIIDGNRANQTWTPLGSANYGLVVRSGDTLIYDLEAKNVTANGMGIAGAAPAQRVTFQVCYSHHNGKKGLHSANPAYVTILGGYYEDNELDSGIGFHQGMKDASVIGAHCNRNGTYGVHVGDSLATADSDSRRVSLVSVHANENLIAGILVAADVTLGDNFADVTISACVLWKNRYGIVTEVAEGVVISTCTIRASKGSGIRLVNPRSITVDANQIYDSGTDAADPSRDGLVLADSPTEPNAGTHGRVVIKANIIIDTQAVATMQVALHFNSDKITADQVELEGNTLQGSVVRNIKDEGTTVGRVKIRNNLGFATESQGTATVLNGTTFVAFNHNLASTPTPTTEEIQLWPTTAWGAATSWWGPTSITGTTARVNTNANPGANVGFGFKGQKAA